jgi:hypothetical protein
VPIASISGRSTTIVLVAGQNDAGGLGLAVGQLSASDALKLSCGGLAGENRVPIASMIERTDCSVTGSSPVSSSGSSTGRSPRR